MAFDIDNPDISVPEQEVPETNVSLDEAEDDLVSVSLKYWHSNSQCLSDWGRDELKKLKKFVDKVQKLTWFGIKSDAGLGYNIHKGPAKGHGFSKPQELSKDQGLIELKVSGDARVHGVESGNLFYLVWLDRKHHVFPK
jgi:hypothetical protein